MISLRNKFDLLSCNGSVVTDIKPKTKENLRAATIMCHVRLRKELTKPYAFFQILQAWIIFWNERCEWWSQWPRGLKRSSPAETVVSNRTGTMDVCLLWVFCIVRQKSLRRANHSSRAVLPTVVRRCMWSRMRMPWPTWGLLRQKKKKGKNILVADVASTSKACVFTISFTNPGH